VPEVWRTLPGVCRRRNGEPGAIALRLMCRGNLGWRISEFAGLALSHTPAAAVRISHAAADVARPIRQPVLEAVFRASRGALPTLRVRRAVSPRCAESLSEMSSAIANCRAQASTQLAIGLSTGGLHNAVSRGIAMMPNNALERQINSGRPVLAMDCVLAGAEVAPWRAAQQDR